MGEESQTESKLAQLQQSLHTFLHDDQNPFAQLFAMAEKYSQNRVKRTHAFWGKYLHSLMIRLLICMFHFQLSASLSACICYLGMVQL